MTLSPNIILGNDYVTAYFADQIWPKTLKDHRKRWDDAAKAGEPSPRSRLSGLSAAYFRTKPDASDGDTDALHSLCGLVVDALGYDVDFDLLGQPQPDTVTLVRGDDLFDLPCVAAVTNSDDHPVLVAVAADTFTTDPTFLVTADAKPATRLHRHGQPDVAIDGTDTVPGLANAVFATEHPPRWILVVAGGAVALLDHKPWLDGKWLGANVDDILSNNDRTSGGELDQLAGWFSTAGTIPDDDGTSLLDTAVDGSQRQAVGVSESLRDAVRAGVEAIANEVLYDRRFRLKKSVFGEQGGVTVDAADLARQSIRWMYRLVVLLYAEARPGIGILPTTNDGTTLYERYEAGYGLERLRQLSLVELESEAARNGTHIHQSLDVLFRLVNEGHHRPSGVELSVDGSDNWTGIEFAGLNSRLFGPKSCPDIDGAQLRDHVLQKIIKELTTAPGDKGRGIQQVSYANLEVNQLGAVYEGLMAYTGFIALEDRNEVAARKASDAKNGVARSADPSRGSWTIPVAEAHRYPDNVFVLEKVDDDSGEMRPVVHEKGSFVFRLTGRDRARSASYYTPSVLTEFTVRHALEEWQSGRADLTAADVLRMTILEPALGSGAFANEACDQAAEIYLRLREAETGETVPADERPTELRKLRAHFAVNQTYGVDLNDTGVELAEVSLWLNSMHPGLAAPSLSHRLRRGNSLVGCTRTFYRAQQIRKQPWKKTKDGGPLPAEAPLRSWGEPGQVGDVHHFLVPGEGWGAAAKTGGTLCRQLAPDWCDAVWRWRKEIQEPPTAEQVHRLDELAQMVEALWAVAASDVSAHLAAQNRQIDVWRGPQTSWPVGSSTRFHDPNGAYRRLKTIMDAWCALWMWAPAHGTSLPTLDQWLDAIDYLCGSPRGDADGRLFGEHTRWDPQNEDADSGALFDSKVEYDTSTSIAEATMRWPWIATCAAISKELGFFHWPLEFAPVLQNGGFDLIVGNPPWTKLSRTDTDVLLDDDPLAALEEWSFDQIVDTSSLLSSSESAKEYLVEFGRSEGMSAFLSSATVYPLVAGSLTNLYLSFMERMFPLIGGVLGLLHQESFYEDPKAADLTAAVYQRLLRHWHFVNEQTLFSDVDHHTEFGVHVYGPDREGTIEHLYAANLIQPHTLDRSMDGTEPPYEPPGKKNEDGDWDVRPHPKKVMRIDAEAMDAFWRLSEPGTPKSSPRLLRLYSADELGALEALLPSFEPVRQYGARFSSGLHESSDSRRPEQSKPKARMCREVAVPSSFSDAIVKGPNINVANPFYQEPNPAYAHSNDNRIIDATELPSDFVPRTVLQATPTPEAAQVRLDEKSKWLASKAWRIVTPEHISRGWVRTLQPAIIPPGTLHGHSLTSLALPTDEETVRVHALMCSTTAEYLIRVMGTDHVGETELGCLPGPETPASSLEELGTDACEQLWQALVARSLRLNCLSSEYADLWATIWRPGWAALGELTSSPFSNFGWDRLRPGWSHDTPLRTDAHRFVAVVEMDALATRLLGIDPALVEKLGRLHLGLQARYESRTAYDAAGRRLSGEHHNRGGRQTSVDQFKAVDAGEWDDQILGGFEAPFHRLDRWELFHEAIASLESVSR